MVIQGMAIGSGFLASSSMMLSGAGMLVAEGELRMKLWMVQSGEGRRRGSVELSERTCWLNPSNYSIGARGESGSRELEFETLCSWPRN